MNEEYVRPCSSKLSTFIWSLKINILQFEILSAGKIKI